MSLTDVMSAAGLQLFAEIGLVLFLVLFLGVLVYTFRGKNRAAFERARHLPLEGDASPAAREGRDRE